MNVSSIAKRIEGMERGDKNGDAKNREMRFCLQRKRPVRACVCVRARCECGCACVRVYVCNA